jgi:hypothetical protein
VILRHAIGEHLRAPLADGAHAVMMIPIPRAGIYNGVSGVEEARALVEDIVITAKQGQAMVPLPEGASYLGFIFGRGVEDLRKAHALLQFDFARTLPVVK